MILVVSVKLMVSVLSVAWKRASEELTLRRVLYRQAVFVRLSRGGTTLELSPEWDGGVAQPNDLPLNVNCLFSQASLNLVGIT